MSKTKLAKAATKTKTVPYDVAEQLRTPEEMAAYLDAWFEEAPDDAAGIARALGDIARARGMSQVARDAGLSRESLYKALSADGNPSFATVLKVARALGCGYTPWRLLIRPGIKRADGSAHSAQPGGSDSRANAGLRFARWGLLPEGPRVSVSSG